MPATPIYRIPRNDIIETIIDQPLQIVHYSENEIREALRLIDKEKIEDELNCGGCGYETCRDFAEAILSGHAEASMCLCPICVDRRSAKPTHCCIASLRPSCWSIKICGYSTAIVSLLNCSAKDLVEAYDLRPGLKGAVLEHILAFPQLFKHVLDSGATLQHDALHVEDRIFQVNIFPIEPGQVTGGVICDITAHEMPREMIAKRAREVIHKNLKTVQEIACKLGENMADTEILLRSLAEGFSPDKPVDDDYNKDR